MYKCRLVRADDFENVFELTRKVHSGLTTLLLGRMELQDRINESVRNVHYPPKRPHGETFFFVLEDSKSKNLIGTSAIFSKVGGYEPFWTYEILESHKVCNRLKVDHKVPYLQVKKIHDGPSEVGSLFLQEDYRGGSNGRLLSLARFLFVAEFPSMFEDEIVAEMRGRVELDGSSPFWAAIGSHFFIVPFEQADFQSNLDKGFIQDLMPVHPIYIPLLPQEAQDVIGKVHPETEAAIHLLKSEGFEKTNLVDVFEAGPVVSCKTQNVRAIKDSVRTGDWEVADLAEDCDEYLIANVSSLSAFEVTVGKAKFDRGFYAIEVAVIEALHLNSNDSIRLVPLRGKGRQDG